MIDFPAPVSNTYSFLHIKVEEVLEKGGAKKETYFTDYTTHLIVGESPDEDVVNEAHDLYERPALRAIWVTLSAAAGKLLPYPSLTGLLWCADVVHHIVPTFSGLIMGKAM